MTGFLTRKIVTIETLGEKLRKVREGKNFSLQETSKKIDIQEKYLSALENGDYHEMPGEAYIKNFLIRYLEFLGLDKNTTLGLYEKEKISSQNKELKPLKKGIVASQVFRKIFQFLIVFFLLAYLGWGVKKIIIPPYLTITSPVDNLITKDNSIKIVGKTEEEASIKINDKLSASNFKGNFEEVVELKPGLNIIKITTSKKHSREKIITRNVMLIY